MSRYPNRSRPWWVWPSVFTPPLVLCSVLDLAWYWVMAAIAVAIVLLELAEGALANRRTAAGRQPRAVSHRPSATRR